MTGHQDNGGFAALVNGNSVVYESKGEFDNVPTSEDQTGMEETAGSGRDPSTSNLVPSVDHTASEKASGGHYTTHQPKNREIVDPIENALHGIDKTLAVGTSSEETPKKEPPSLEATDHPIGGASLKDLILTKQALFETISDSSGDASLNDPTLTNQAPSEAINPLSEDAPTEAQAPLNHAPSGTITHVIEHTSSEDPIVTTSAPSVATHHPTEHASSKDPTFSNQVLSELIVETNQTNDVLVNPHTVGDNFHPGISQPTTETPLENSSTSEKRPGNEILDASALGAEHVSVLPEPGAAAQAPLGPVANFEPAMDPKESKTVVPAANDASTTSNLASAPGDSSKEEESAGTVMGRTEPVLEALPKSETSVAEDPASAIAAINNAAAELDHTMHLNKNVEVDHGLFVTDSDSMAYAHSGLRVENRDETQHHEKAAPSAGNEISFAGGPFPAFNASQAIQTPMDVQERRGVQSEAKTSADSTLTDPTPADPTPASSTPPDTEMDDGSSVSTIHAYLGAHAPSLGTGSVDGNPGDTLMDDGDSALGDDVDSITESLSASMLEYRYENGRRYHAFEDGKYHLPNDEKEADRLDFQHHIWLLTLNGELHRAPIPSTIQNALDVGTGTGIWAIEFANAFPNARVIGTDLSPIQPSWVPPNLSFMVDDAEAFQDWEFPQKFDYIHSRLVALSMRDWPRYMKRCYNNLKPGGWIELQEVQFPFRYDENFPPNDSPLLKWSGYVLEATSRVGIDTQAATKFVDMLGHEGFVNISKEEIRWSIGSWSKDSKEKEIGKWMVYNALEGVESAGMALFSRVFGWSKEEIEVFLENVREDIRNKENRYYTPITVHYAQKPFESRGEE